MPSSRTLSDQIHWIHSTARAQFVLLLMLGEFSSFLFFAVCALLKRKEKRERKDWQQKKKKNARNIVT